MRKTIFLDSSGKNTEHHLGIEEVMNTNEHRSRVLSPGLAVRKMAIRREVWAALAAALAVCAVCILVVPARRTLLVDRFPQVPPPALQFDHMHRAMSWQRGIEHAPPGCLRTTDRTECDTTVPSAAAPGAGGAAIDSVFGQGLD
jgi:hypothetical protein